MSNTKKTLVSLLSCALSLFALSSCEQALRFELQNMMNEQGEQCPKNAGVGMTLTKAELNDSCCLYVIEYDADRYPTQFEQHAKAIRAQLLGNINNPDPDKRTPLNELAEAAKKCGVPIVYVYQNNKTRAEVVVKITPDDIAD